MPLDPFDMGQISFFLPYQSVDNLGCHSSTTTQKGKQKKGAWKDQMINSEKAQGSGGTVLRQAFLYTSEAFSNDE